MISINLFWARGVDSSRALDVLRYVVSSALARNLASMAKKVQLVLRLMTFGLSWYVVVSARVLAWREWEESECLRIRLTRYWQTVDTRQLLGRT